MLSHALLTNRSLVQLDLAHTQMSSTSAQLFAQALKRNTSLQEVLKLCPNRFVTFTLTHSYTTGPGPCNSFALPQIKLGHTALKPLHMPWRGVTVSKDLTAAVTRFWTKGPKQSQTCWLAYFSRFLQTPSNLTHVIHQTGTKYLHHQSWHIQLWCICWGLQGHLQITLCK